MAEVLDWHREFPPLVPDSGRAPPSTCGMKPALPSSVGTGFDCDADTARRHIDVAAAFAATESPTSPVRELVPLDAVPVLTVERTALPWDDLGQLATQLLLRVDGRTSAMDIVTGSAFAPRECATELAALMRRGLVRLLPVPRSADDEAAVDATAPEDDLVLEIDLTAL
jgi:hypothetical protein